MITHPKKNTGELYEDAVRKCAGEAAVAETVTVTPSAESVAELMTTTAAAALQERRITFETIHSEDFKFAVAGSTAITFITLLSEGIYEPGIKNDFVGYAVSFVSLSVQWARRFWLFYLLSCQTIVFT
jgi:hypothetical protein